VTEQGSNFKSGLCLS